MQCLFYLATHANTIIFNRSVSIINLPQVDYNETILTGNQSGNCLYGFDYNKEQGNFQGKNDAHH